MLGCVGVLHMYVCDLIYMRVHFLRLHTVLLSLYNSSCVSLSLCACLCLFVCACMHAYRCTRPCRAILNAASMSGGLSPGPFVPSTPWMTCQPVERESKAARSGQLVGLAWQTASTATLTRRGRLASVL